MKAPVKRTTHLPPAARTRLRLRAMLRVQCAVQAREGAPRVHCIVQARSLLSCKCYVVRVSKPAVQSSSQEISPTPAAQSSGQGIPSTPPAQGTPLLSNQDDNPGRKLIYIEQAGKNALPPRIPRKLRLLPNSELTRRAFWDVAATLSLVINAILIGVLIVMALQINHLKTTVNTLSALSNNMLGGLYGNFVKMGQASINTTITVMP